MSEPLLRILVADDEPTARILMKAALEKTGFAVSLAANGEEALARFHDQPCDMVMLDVEMPSMNGYEVCARLRREIGDELPVVMVTGMDDLESVERAFTAGATDFLSKPINWGLIGHRVRYLFRSYQVLQDLHAAHASNTAILNAIPDSLLRLDDAGRVVDAHAGPRIKENRHIPPVGALLDDCLPAETAAKIRHAARQAREFAATASVDYALPCEDGQLCYYEARLSSIDGQGALCLIRDLTTRRRAEENAYRLAFFDTLTGLPNRLSFSQRLDREIQRARYNRGRLSVLFLDLDGFKSINDTLGYDSGDRLLQSVADRLGQCLRPTDLVARNSEHDGQIELARLGGDEFTVLIANLRSAQHALDTAQRIQELMRQPFDVAGRPTVLSASIGIAMFPEDGEDASTLLKHADTAMYHAKDQGRDNCQFYSAALTEEAVRRLTLKNDLRLALERGEFFLAYQPQLNLATGKITSLEALVRWRHPERGLIPPMEFIPAAEENGLIAPIGEWVLRQACADGARWLAGGTPLKIAVNLSAVQFKNPGLLAQVNEILTDTGLPPALLELEVTEGALMADTTETMATLTALRAAGIFLSLDDFGTGYSSLSYLKRLPLNSLKVDQSFVRGLPAERESLAIVRAIVALAKNLGFEVTAEGIETLEQARLLQDLHCETLQGYYISRPVTADAILPLLEKYWHLDA